ncbi:MAG: hypothetical protein EOO92_07460 [Pedobacter sp.]|nr:MAG: hypothetical protein EOO92_07460 [Pedobacter sp.]
MGKYKKGILGNFRGKVGSVIGSVWKGIYYMRSISETSSADPSPAQLNARLRFAMVINFLSNIKTTINVGYQKFTKGITPLNAAASYLLKYGVTGTAPAYEINYPKVVISVGDLDNLENLSALSSTPGEIKFDWDVNVGMQDGLPTDRVTIVAFCPELDKFITVRNVVARSATTYTLSFPANFSGSAVYLWVMLTSADGKEVSKSQYMGNLNIL